MKTIIAGSRHVESYTAIEMAVWLARQRKGIRPSEVVSGCQRGADKLGEAWAARNGLPVKRFPADWDSFGPGAGPIRNEAMAKYGDALIAIWDGISQGTRDMIDRAKQRGLIVYVYRVLKPKKNSKLGDGEREGL